MKLLPRFVKHKGRKDSAKAELLPVGLSRVITDGQLGIAFVSADGEVTDMFSLDPGKHRVKFPGDRHVIVECDPSVQWTVMWPGRFNLSDPTRIDASIVRPRSQQQELQDYVNELSARTMSRLEADALRSGNAEMDISQDDYTEELPEDDTIGLPSIHQLGIMIDELKKDLEYQRQVEAEEISDPSPTEDPLLPPGGTGAPAPVVNENES